MKRTDIINKFIEKRGYSRYIEIGVSTGENFSAVKCRSKIGVDPDKSSKATVLEPSDMFFPRFIQSKGKADIVFVDGLHTCDQALRDIENALLCLNPGGVVIVHDCLPWSAHVGSHDVHDGHWCGDVYRAVIAYFAKSDYLCYTVDADTGCAIIDTALPSTGRPAFTWRSMFDISYEDMDKRRKELLNVVSSDDLDTLMGEPEIVRTSSTQDPPKILFVAAARGLDYENDALFHGLVRIGCDVTDSKYMWYLSEITHDQKVQLYGRGFSIAGKLDDRSDIDRSDETIRKRIAEHYYDAVVYGSVHRSMDYLEEVEKVYSRDSIVFVDGEDSTNLKNPIVGRGVYFKRERVASTADRTLPISFAIPDEQFDKKKHEKDTDFASQIPGKKGKTYEFFDEDEYYAAYSRSRFALTTRKMGWDCMRHYEIIAAGALPLFPEIDYCPAETMVNWPKDMQRSANRMAYNWFAGHRDPEEYDKLLAMFVSYARDSLTTESLARYVLGKIGIFV